jgi:hypothetical protein
MKRQQLAIFKASGFVQAAVLVTIIMLSYQGGRRMFTHVYAQTQLSVRPYTMAYDDYVVSDGKEKITSHTVESRRPDGAIHRSQTHTAVGMTPEATFRGVSFPDGTEAFRGA